MLFTIAVYQHRHQGDERWTTLGLGEHTKQVHGRQPLKIQQALVGLLKDAIGKVEVRELERFQMRRGMWMERLHLELSVRVEGRRRNVAGTFPVVVEPRWTSATKRILVAFHPDRQEEWFPADSETPLAEQASHYFAQAWADLSVDAVDALKSNHKDRLQSISFSARPNSLMDRLPKRQKGVWGDLVVSRRASGEKKGRTRKRRRGPRVLHRIGVNLTSSAIDGSLPMGMPRSPYREQLGLLLGSERKASTVLVGPSGVGKSTLLHRYVGDLLEADGWATHRNLDKIHEVWRISGKRIIAGMMFWGDWEKRCLEVLQDARGGHRILLVEDLHAWGRIGRSRESERNLAQFFEGPLARGEIILVAETTLEGMQRLEDDAPAFAALFTRLTVQPTTAGETMRMMLHESRTLELQHRVEIHPFVFRLVLELGGSLMAGAAFPGKALDLLRELSRDAAESVAETLATTGSAERGLVGPEDLIELLSRKTGLPRDLLAPESRLLPGTVEEAFTRHVAGQTEAVAAAADLVMRIRAGMTDPKRPYGVYLFTGPTGTGKTEMAKGIAAYLYGDENRLVRFDMGEYGTAGGAARLIGDRWRPEGLLTQRVREQPFCVVLLDEIEKADRGLLNLLLQLFDEGRLTDASGNTADFTHAVLIMTSNLGSRARAPVRFGDPDEGLMGDVERAVREFFPPELFNRIDRIVPFQPLTNEAATRILDKELAKLLARPGLAGRNIFVSVSTPVRERLVTEGCDPRYGARPLKKHLEERIGTVLTEHIAKGSRASMQMIRIYDQGGATALSAEPLEEVQPIESALALEPLLELPLAEAQQRLRVATDAYDELERSEEFLTLPDEIRRYLDDVNRGRTENAGLLYHLEALRERLGVYRETLERLVPSWGRQRHGIAQQGARTGGQRSFRPFGGRLLGGARNRVTRDQLLAIIAEAFVLRRALRKVREPGQHSVFIELLRIGEGEGPSRDRSRTQGALRWMVNAYADARGEREECAARFDDGTLVGNVKLPIRAETECVVLKVSGLCVLDFFEGENGCHVWQSLARTPEIVRVNVTPANGETSALDTLRAHGAGVEAFHEALERGKSPLPPNPESLLPVVRQVRFEPPMAEGATAPIEVDDFLLGASVKLTVREPKEGLAWMWRLRESRGEW